MLLGRGIQNFRKLAQLKISKNREELYNDVNISETKNWNNCENTGNFSKFKKPKISILRNIIRKAHAKISGNKINGKYAKSRYQAGKMSSV